MKTKENLDKHHIMHKPSKIVLIPHRKHEIIHGISPIENELTLKVRQYDMLTKILVAIANRKHAYLREFGLNPINVNTKKLEDKKAQFFKDEIKPLIRKELFKVKHIKGLGPVNLARLLAYAHPNRFPTVGRYLYYCGYTKASKITKRYSRKACSTVYLITTQLIRHKDPKYYPLYLKIKEEQPKEYSKVSKHRIAMNRTATLFLKEFYSLFHEEESFKC